MRNPLCVVSMTLSVLYLFLMKPVSAQSGLDLVTAEIRNVYGTQWEVSRYGNRIVMQKKDSVCILKPEETSIPLSTSPVRYPFQLFLDFRDSDFFFKDAIRKSVNDSIKKIIHSYKNQGYAKGKFMNHEEAAELLESRLLQEPYRVRLYDIWFSDNTNSEWVVCEWSELKHFPVTKPTKFQQQISAVKENIKKLLRDHGN